MRLRTSTFARLELMLADYFQSGFGLGATPPCRQPRLTRSLAATLHLPGRGTSEVNFQAAQNFVYDSSDVGRVPAGKILIFTVRGGSRRGACLASVHGAEVILPCV